jgi:hypothetical protein
VSTFWGFRYEKTRKPLRLLGFRVNGEPSAIRTPDNLIKSKAILLGKNQPRNPLQRKGFKFRYLDYLHLVTLISTFSKYKIKDTEF